jgi:2-polyprenyl-3-methyl-5-hydroxy-6-metoxy-1,4-benzoquinol methylase
LVNSLDMGYVPFYWRIKKTKTQPPYDIPNRLPFAFSFINDVQLVIQKRNPQVLHWLERVYKEDSNVGYLQEGHTLADAYGGEFIDFFRRSSELLLKPPATAADIGCGGVYLLQKVRELGLMVKGIDPSPVTTEAGRKAGIEIISDFYPSRSLTERFDILFHYDVLEHVEDPVGFLRAHHTNLSQYGAVVFAVPDCSRNIAIGDVSILLHEHLNYFDQDSLSCVVRAAGFEPVLLERARHGGVLLCCAVPAAKRARLPTVSKDASKFLKFRSNAEAALRRFSELSSERDIDELGLYVPLRAFPYLGSIAPEVRLRFFDDDPGLHGCFFDGFDIAIENRDDLLAKPAAVLMVCSLAFGREIAARLRKQRLDDTPIVLWSDLFNGGAE